MITVLVAAVVFGVCLWVGRSASFGWMPKEEANRWVVATAFATVMATVAATAAGWWAAHEQPATAAPPAERVVSQKATASGQGRVNQAGGNQNAPSSPAAGAGGGPGRVEQEAEASDSGSVNQVGADQHTRPGNDGQQQP
ncbi:hypothetical protein BM536_038800 [Streptomyces phaeoluteigriseus]|uniref:Uncharacterized protein n=1 Tax=Streptomyces phaeoluteigriseus TaxID=114686 RepID=A0A1V6MH75_9ACTN|nr:hypothetical protein BM536_038800 [Streptomyces phaeoluteigriseus]